MPAKVNILPALLRRRGKATCITDVIIQILLACV